MGDFVGDPIIRQNGSIKEYLTIGVDIYANVTNYTFRYTEIQQEFLQTLNKYHLKSVHL